MAPLRWAIIGAGKISHDFATAIKILPEEHKLVAVGSRTKQSADIFAKNHNIPKTYEGYEGIAKDEEVDVVYIGNLNTQHFATTKLMIESGKPVLCEKPFTLNEKQTTELVQLARKKKVFLMEAVWSRCFPVYKKVREIIDHGTLGEVMFVDVTFGFDLRTKARVTDKQLGGGAILDVGVYCLQLQQFIYRGCNQTKMVVNGNLTDEGVDGTTAAVISYDKGKLAIVTCSAEVLLPNEAVIVGSNGTIRIPQFWCPTEMILNENTFRFDLPDNKGDFKHANSAGLLYEANEVKRCLQEGELESPAITSDETIELARLMDVMRKEVGLIFPEDR